MQLKNKILFVLVLGSLLFLSSCGAKKAVVSTPATPETVVPAWHTCVLQGAQMLVVTDEDRLSATANIQVVRDSMLIISVMPMLGMELLRIEATPTQITAIDKLHGRYAVATYAEINRKVFPEINWTVLQQLCSAELPTGSEKARLRYTYNEKETLDITITYPQRQTDVPVRMTAAKLDRYTQVDIQRWL